jgi:hypothetical protein
MANHSGDERSMTACPDLNLCLFPVIYIVSPYKFILCHIGTVDRKLKKYHDKLASHSIPVTQTSREISSSVSNRTETLDGPRDRDIEFL